VTYGSQDTRAFGQPGRSDRQIALGNPSRYECGEPAQQAAGGYASLRIPGYARSNTRAHARANEISGNLTVKAR
jgi:hypothetical protein